MSVIDSSSIVTRIERTLARLGFNEVQIEHLGDGKIAIVCEVERDDQCLIKAATQTVVGVTSVSVKSK
jgi:nitrate reductase NapAB chaperone NapD